MRILIASVPCLWALSWGIVFGLVFGLLELMQLSLLLRLSLSLLLLLSLLRHWLKSSSLGGIVAAGLVKQRLNVV